MKFSVRFFSSFYLLLLCIGVSGNLSAAQTDKPERWFEIEVILFKQLGDKNLLKELFPDNVNSASLPQYTKYFDTLTSYVQPDLSGIKQFMPLCSEDNSQVDLTSLPKIHVNFSDAVNAMSHIDTFNISNSTNNINDNSYLLEQQKKQTLTLQKDLVKPLFSTQNMCVISYNDVENLLSEEQLTTFKLNGFNIEALPKNLHPTGLHNPHAPYLIADESLLLTDISQRLQWSKEFKPLLHFGWRQVAVTQGRAVPLKIFAGNNLNSQYQKSLKNYQSRLDTTKIEPVTIEQLENESQQNIDIATDIIILQKNDTVEIKQQQLSKTFSEIKHINNDSIIELINVLEQQTLEDIITNEADSILDNKQLKISKPPVLPLQEWFLDGYFKVHLDHYLYITADFNVLSESLITSTSQITESLSEDISSANRNTNKKLINFSQNRRAITGEIHYFDHPFVGMIVQIRRFDPTKPKGEAVSQVIK
jgi:hypothetical protein